MADVGQDEKAKAKAAAAKAAVDLNDTSLLYGAAAAVVGVAGAASIIGAVPAGVVAGTLGVCAFAIGVVGNRYQRLANDPPRDDYDGVTVSTASFTGPNVSGGDFNDNGVRLAAHALILSDALDALVTSLERYDGAVAAGDTAAAGTQVQAVSQNAAAVTAAVSVIQDAAAAMNSAWVSATDLDWSTVTVSDIQSNYLSAAGPPRQPAGQPLSDVLGLISNLANPAPFDTLDAAADPILNASDVPARPDGLFPPAALDSLQAAADAIGALVQDGPGVA